jgi:hypothetical protein
VYIYIGTKINNNYLHMHSLLPPKPRDNFHASYTYIYIYIIYLQIDMSTHHNHIYTSLSSTRQVVQNDSPYFNIYVYKYTEF